MSIQVVAMTVRKGRTPGRGTSTDLQAAAVSREPFVIAPANLVTTL